MKALLPFLLTFVVTSAFGWGSQGHQVIATLAAAQLTPKARGEVDRLLELEPGATLASISTWADEHRNPATGPWHYVNFPRQSCTYDQQRDCPAGHCVVGAIDKQLEVLTSSQADDKRLTALKYVVHFVGDVHQPLHAGYQDDKGGNTYQLQAFGRGSNLHSLWDSGLIRNMNEGTDILTKRWLASSSSAQGGDVSVIHAAEESCRVVGMAGFYPDRQVGADYIATFTPILEQRLALAGSRLAGLLNRLFR